MPKYLFYIAVFMILNVNIACSPTDRDAYATDESINLTHEHNNPGNRQERFIYGIMLGPNDAPYRDRWERYYRICNDLNVGYLKIAVFWDHIEPEPGVRNWKGQWPNRVRPGAGSVGARGGISTRDMKDRSFSATKVFDFDFHAKLAQQYDVSVFPRFMGPRGRELVSDSQGFAKFVYDFIARYNESMNIQYVEFQNEPNAHNDGSGGGRHWKGTAAQLAAMNTAAYEKVKAEYPDIQIGTAGFMTGSRQMFANYTSKFLQAYFKAQPKFDVFMLHDYPMHLSYTQGTHPGDFGSEYHIFQNYRNLLQNYGYGQTPILVSEGYEIKPMRTSAGSSMKWSRDNQLSRLIQEGFLITKTQASAYNVIGKVMSEINRGRGQTPGLIDTSTNKKTKLYYEIKHLIKNLRAYPHFVKRVSGKLNSTDYWTLEFESKDFESLWISFIPVLYQTNNEILTAINDIKSYQQQTVQLNVGDRSQVTVEYVGEDNSVVSKQHKVPDSGIVSFDITKNVVFVY